MSIDYVDVNINTKISFKLTSEGLVYFNNLYKKEFNLNWNYFHVETLWAFFYEFKKLNELKYLLASKVELKIKVEQDGIVYNSIFLNLNNPVRFQLSEDGKRIFPELLKMEKNGYIEMMLDDFLEITGNYYYNGGVVILKNNQVGIIFGL